MVAIQFHLHHLHAHRAVESHRGFGGTSRQGVVHRGPSGGGAGTDVDIEAHCFVRQDTCVVANASFAFFYSRYIGTGFITDTIVHNARQQGLRHGLRSALSVVGDAFHHFGFLLSHLEHGASRGAERAVEVEQAHVVRVVG